MWMIWLPRDRARHVATQSRGHWRERKGRWCEVVGRASYKLDPRALIPYEKEKTRLP